MATPTVALAPLPHWVVIDNFSKLPPGAVIYTYNSSNKSLYQAAYVDAGGTIPYPQPIPEWGSGNGTFPPIYWSTTVPYYIQVWTGDRNANGSTMLWDFDGLLGGVGGGGGGGTITNNVVENLIANNTFFRPAGTIGNPGAPINPNTTNGLVVLSPGNNQGYVNNTANTNGYTGPDNVFAKSNLSATDAIAFDQFIPTGVGQLNADVTPPYYVNFNCSGAGSGETYKFFQFPVSNGIVNLSGQNITVRLWANSISGNQNIQLVVRQFYGDGGSPSADITTVCGSGPLPFMGYNQWELFTFPLTLPVASGTIGTCGNDGTFLQIQVPLAQTLNFGFTKPGVFLGSPLNIAVDYHNNDYIDSIVNSPRTGDIRMSLNSFMPGWVVMNDGVISNGTGSFTPPAGYSVARRNLDTFPLFDLIWQTFQATPLLVPMFDSAGNPQAMYGSSSFADFTNNMQLALTKAAGRVMAGVGSGSGLTTRTIGQTTGSEVITIAAMANHNHPGSFWNLPFGTFSGGAPAQVPVYVGGSPASNTPVTIAAQGGGAADGDMQPTVFMNVFIKL